MRFACVLLAIVAACDLQPPPKKAPPPPPPAPVQLVAPDAAPAAPTPTDEAAAQPGSGSAGSGRPVAPKIQTRPECLDIGVRVAMVLIDTTTDVAQKAALEQDRTKIVKSTAETCTKDSWSSEVIACLQKADNMSAMTACTRNLKAPE
ncbi:MAG: hypothetical protein NT062_16665 [Proteobacteria bacterium]|nr:hypothetical protein [Pseudomonadota bacterium]